MAAGSFASWSGVPSAISWPRCEHNHPVGIEAQTRLAMENIRGILDHEGLAWPTW